jgi:AI-2 transport protein TqsA
VAALTPDPIPATDRGRLLSAPVGGLFVLVLTLGAAVLLREVASLIVPLLFGVFLALVASPLVEGLARRGLRRSIALAVTILVVLVLILGTAAIVGLSVGELVVLVPGYEDRLTDVIDSLRSLLEGLGIDADPQALLSIIPPEQIASLIRSLASTISSAGVAILIVVLTMAYALVGAASIKTRAERAFGPDHALLVGVQRFGGDLRRYLIVRAQLGLFAAVVVLLLLFVLGVPLPALWAFLVFAASFIPNIGVIVAVIPPTFLALLDSGLGAAVAVVVGYVIVNFIQDNFLQPLVLGTELNLTPLVVFVAVVVWAWILGAAGALLAVPLTVGLVAILEAFPASRGIAVLMRSKVDEPAGLVGEPASVGIAGGTSTAG